MKSQSNLSQIDLLKDYIRTYMTNEQFLEDDIQEITDERVDQINDFLRDCLEEKIPEWLGHTITDDEEETVD